MLNWLKTERRLCASYIYTPCPQILFAVLMSPPPPPPASFPGPPQKWRGRIWEQGWWGGGALFFVGVRGEPGNEATPPPPPPNPACCKNSDINTHMNQQLIPLCKTLLYAGIHQVLLDSHLFHSCTGPLLPQVALSPETLFQSLAAVW